MMLVASSFDTLALPFVAGFALTSLELVCGAAGAGVEVEHPMIDGGQAAASQATVYCAIQRISCTTGSDVPIFILYTDFVEGYLNELV
jgi:hypothetical protein